MNRFTRQERWALCVVTGLLLVGWAVKAYRTAHPAAIPAIASSSQPDKQPIIPVEQSER